MLQDIIRSATHHSHHRLDLALTWLDVSRPRYYAGFLRGQAEALFPIEAALARGGIERLLPDWHYRARARALDDDLAIMDVSTDPLPLPRFANDAQMLGAVYVLEATRMGARVMLARLAEYPDSVAIGATNYLKHGFGKRLWPSFLAVLEQHSASRNNPAGVVQGAEIAFGMFEATLIPIASIAAE
jgi:heme oxygenase (biliverdin-IX-beta and delta-forming)